MLFYSKCNVHGKWQQFEKKIATRDAQQNYLWRQMIKSFSILTYQISLGFVALELGIDLKSKQYLGFRQ